MTDPYDYLFKFLVIGSAGTGKSCLLHQVTLIQHDHKMSLFNSCHIKLVSKYKFLPSSLRVSSRRTVHTQSELSLAAKLFPLVEKQSSYRFGTQLVR